MAVAVCSNGNTGSVSYDDASVEMVQETLR